MAAVAPSPRKGRVLAAAVVAAALAAAGPSAAPAQGGEGAGFRSAAVCRECHPQIYDSWRSSEHASAFTDPAFQLPYDRIRRTAPSRVLPCEQCHNPMRFALPPGAPQGSIFAQEGITCDFCHSTETVDPGGTFPRYRLRGGVKFGPGGGSEKGPHRTQFSRLHISSSFCGGCHEFRNAHGVDVLSTYSEWAASFYRGEGIHCQFCHLPQLFDARFVDADREGTGKRKGPSDHAMVGGHDRDRLAKAVPIRAELSVRGGDARLSIRLRNETVGHKVPTGIPTHRLRLVSTLFDGNGAVLGRKEEIFARVLGDGTGKAITLPELIFTAAREVISDNRIAPKETREVVHAFPSGGAGAATAEVALVYEMATPDIAPELKWIEIPVSRVVIPVRSVFPFGIVVAVVLAGTAAGLVVLALLARRRKG